MDAEFECEMKVQTYRNDRYKLIEIEKQHLKQLKMMSLSLFPIVYDNDFYKSILAWPVKQMAFERNSPIGSICANIESHDGVTKMYIAILGVMIFWRRRGIGALLLDFLEEYCKKEPSISSIYLHVQKDNKDAQHFYSGFGFVITQEIENFYRRTSCPTAVIMEKILLPVTTV